jgi:hypothetical protein
VYIDGEKVAESIHDLFGEGEHLIEDYDLVYEGNDQYPLLPELVFSHQNYENVRLTILKAGIKSFTVEVLERFIIKV